MDSIPTTPMSVLPSRRSFPIVWPGPSPRIPYGLRFVAFGHSGLFRLAFTGFARGGGGTVPELG